MTSFNGTGGNDSLGGGSLADIFDATHAGGQDTMAGGAGNDTYYVDDSGDVITETLTGGTADIAFTTVNYTLAANVESLTLNGGTSLSVSGNATNNVITDSA